MPENNKSSSSEQLIYIRSALARLDQLIAEADARQLDHIAILLSRARDAFAELVQPPAPN